MQWQLCVLHYNVRGIDWLIAGVGGYYLLWSFTDYLQNLMAIEQYQPFITLG